MSTNVTVDAEGTVTGNTFDKYGSTNPVEQRMMRGFMAALDSMLDVVSGVGAPKRILEIGVGEGHVLGLHHLVLEVRCGARLP